jgi:hypothetical protein
LFRDDRGHQIKQKAYEAELFEVLREIQTSHPELIDPDDDVPEVYGVSRSLRRGYTSHAMNVNIPDSDIKRLA